MMASRLEEEKSERLHPLVWALAIVQPEKNGYRFVHCCAYYMPSFQ